MLEGYIESEKTLECTACSDLIPNCKVCQSAFGGVACNLCEQYYYETALYFDDGAEHSVCLKNYCGTEGYGETCLLGQTSTLSNCRKAENLAFADGSQHDNCV